MKIAFKDKVSGAEKKSNGRVTRVRAAKKCLPRAWRARGAVKPEAVVRTPVTLDPLPAAPKESLSRDSLQLYLNEIGQVKLLTPEEELALAKQVKRGNKKARERMITANLRLVVRIARDYENLGLPLLDLINEGNIGLMKGVERFDPGKGAKLSYYAAWWIKQSMMRALANQSKTIRLPVHVVDKMAHIRRAEVKLRELFGHEPTDHEIAEHLNLDVRRIQQYRDASKTPVSLDAPLGHDEPKPIADVVADTNAAAPFDQLVRENDRGLVREALATLDERESKILALRFGLDNGNPKTLEEIAVRFDVTRERIRQIQDGALKKMRVKIEASETPVLDEELELV
ncbi:MAG TPA: sigma-70 family RNA polymerase sigma factor [Verrucomicrobiae bacterium]|jgi:RNA polymerase primary sigma factor